MGRRGLILGLFFFVLVSEITAAQLSSERMLDGARDGVKSIKRGYVEIPEGQVHYRTQGSGPVLLLIHQVVRSSDEYSRLIPLLARNYRIIAMDTLGYGESDQPPRPYQIPDYARSVISFLDVLGIDKVSLLGHHSGGKVAVEVAATHPERVEKLILSALPYGYIHREGDPMPEKYRPMKVEADGSHLIRIWNEQTGGDLGKATSSSKELPVDIRYEITLEYLKAGPRSEEGHYAARHYSRIIDERLKLVRAPTLIMCGREDPWISGVERISKLIPVNEAFIIEGPGTDGNIMRRRPEAVAVAVLNFLQRP